MNQLYYFLPLASCCWSVPRHAAEPKLERFAYTEPHMGTKFQMLVYAGDEKTARAATTAAFGASLIWMVS